MVTRKSNREIELMRIAGRIVAMAHKAVKDTIKPGMTTKDIDDLVEQVIRQNDAIPSFKNYNGFPASACVSINEEVVHGIPSPHRVLKNGDIVSVDIGAIHKGYHGDSAWTYACGEISEEAKNLLEGTEKSLFAGLEYAKANNRLSDISHEIQKTAEGLGFSVVREFVGHGIGKKLHEDPQIPNYGLPHRGLLLKSGMTLAIEPMINFGNKEVKVLSDGWTTITRDKSISAHFEHTVLIKKDGYEILTKI
ncbi:MAG: type I methionyl aminopeptidase [Tenericutes bacterium]|nr:type I methionyl aminopeptidase [Mycoplasmatota bacterium]